MSNSFTKFALTVVLAASLSPAFNATAFAKDATVHEDDAVIQAVSPASDSSYKDLIALAAIGAVSVLPVIAGMKTGFSPEKNAPRTMKA